VKWKAEFVTSVARVPDAPTTGLPEIALIGRSNVGKSSLINALVDRRQLAKTSSTPGKTQLLNYFIINDSFYLVDMPGYGYAKTAKTDRHQWAKLSETYFTTRKQLIATGILIDSRHQNLNNDIDVVEWFHNASLPFFMVLTKSDKVKQQELASHVKLLRESIFSAKAVFPTSSEKGTGIRQLRQFLAELAGNPQLMDS
jgi:GTP-binding protein